MGQCKDVTMKKGNTVVIENGVGSWESGKKELTLTKGQFGEIAVDDVCTVVSAGGTSPPPTKGTYTCLESTSSKKRFKHSD